MFLFLSEKNSVQRYNKIFFETAFRGRLQLQQLHLDGEMRKFVNPFIGKAANLQINNPLKLRF
ncbi:MAG: hypothetical protein BGN96_06060 [Bacteroidales bacterium 45-6]|nr:MAG: hypothetical protein BGN96_06060 [Bacteroidales bacterium 45-6]